VPTGKGTGSSMHILTASEGHPSRVQVPQHIRRLACCTAVDPVKIIKIKTALRPWHGLPFKCLALVHAHHLSSSRKRVILLLDLT
jgi:hypothetical protein